MPSAAASRNEAEEGEEDSDVGIAAPNEYYDYYENSKPSSEVSYHKFDTLPILIPLFHYYKVIIGHLWKINSLLGSLERIFNCWEKLNSISSGLSRLEIG